MPPPKNGGYFYSGDEMDKIIFEIEMVSYKGNRMKFLVLAKDKHQACKKVFNYFRKNNNGNKSLTYGVIIWATPIAKDSNNTPSKPDLII